MKRIIYFTWGVLVVAGISVSSYGNDKHSAAINHYKSLGGYVLDGNRSIDISANRKITDKDLRYLEEIPGIENLSLSNTNITDEGLKSVKILKNLVSLHIGQTKITDEGLKSINDLTNLKILSLDNTLITNEGLKILGNLTNLMEL